MSKVLIDRELLERAVYRLELVYDADAPIVCDLSSVLSAPSGTPAMPVKAYYHEAPNEYGGLNKSVGLEVRKEFADAPLVLESDALARITYLEGEIAKRDARIVELESDLAGTQSRVLSLQDQWRKLDAELAALKAQYQRDVYGLNNEGDPIGGDPAGGYANDNARLRSELARFSGTPETQVSVPDGWRELAKRADDFLYSLPETDGVLRLRADLCSMLAAPAAPAADAGVNDHD